jgi:ATPase subunit of ABC transporter with duplicated ATPase domains
LLLTIVSILPHSYSPNWDWSFPDAGQLPVPVLAIENVSFNYPGGKELYSKVDFGVDLQTRVALVGPNGGACIYCFISFRPSFQ